jgi:tetratricopeptide (TPR) repeat protein
LLFILFIGSSPSVASPEEAKAMVKSGIQAFKDGDLDQARQHLESAVRLGSTSRSLTYNLGVIYFKLGRFEQARETFEKLIPTRQTALAYYNIGLVELALKNEPAAEIAFRQVLASEPEENLRTLALAQLDRMKPEPTPPTDGKSWVALVSAGAGYQSNVALFPSDAPESIDSEFLETIAAASGYLVGSARSGLKANVNLYSRHYPSAHRFDLQVAKLSGLWVERTRLGDLGLGVGSSIIWRDQKQREQHTNLFTTLTLAACPGKSARCALELDATKIDPETPFEAYQGYRYRAEMDYRRKLGTWTTGLRYQLEHNDRQNLETTGEYYDLSPVRHELRGTLRYPLSPSLTLKTEASVRFSRYSRPHRIDTASGTLNDTRKDVRGSVSVGGVYQFTQRLNLALEVNHTDNQSNINRYEYDRQTASLTTAFKF